MIEWLETRAIETETVARLGVNHYLKGKENWLEIPYIKNGEKVNAKHRCLDEKKFFQEKDGEKIFYNYDCLFDSTLDEQPLIITEGEIDAWTFIQSGYPKVISVPEGAPNETHDGDGAKYKFLDGMMAKLKSQPKIILAVDGDKNGQNLLHDMAKRIGRGKCEWIKYPKDCKDINDALVKYGVKGVEKTLETAKPLSMDGVYTLDTLPPVKESELFETGHDTEHLFKYRLHDFSVWTGIPSMGKTTVANDVICSTVLKNKINVCFASFEQHPRLDHLRNLRAWYKGKFPQSSQYDAELWINKHFSFIYPNDEQQLNDEMDLDWFLGHAEYAVQRMNAKIIVLDPWNELEHIPYRDQSLTEYVGMAIRKLKRFAKVMDVHMQVIAHPTKQQKDSDGNFKIPSLYEISDSSHWYNKSDLGVVIHRDTDGHTIFKTAKSRYHEIIGKVGTQKLVFDEKKKSFNKGIFD